MNVCNNIGGTCVSGTATTPGGGAQDGTALAMAWTAKSASITDAIATCRTVITENVRAGDR
jgi:hypothetical protein